ncbi:hypothetical protein BH11PLA2_BH11PLA2_07660 [soil metagenome]
MKRHHLKDEDFKSLKSRYQLSSAEIIVENSEDTDGTPIHNQHRLLADHFEKSVKDKALSPLDDIYVDYDFFRSRILNIYIEDGKADMQEAAEVISIALIGMELFNDFCVQLMAGSDGLPKGGLRELITANGIYVLVSQA